MLAERSAATTQGDSLTTLQFRAAALAVAALPVLLLAGCSPECVDAADCASKAEAAQAEFTCVSNKCVEGSPFNDGGVEEDAGTGGGGGTDEDAGTGGGGGGGGMTGGGGGSTADDGGADAGGGNGGDAGPGDDGGTSDAGSETDAGSTPSPEGTYIATLSGAQAGSLSTETGNGTFMVLANGDAGYTLTWSITHTAGSGGGTTGGIRTGLAGFTGTAWITFNGAGSPINGMQVITPAQANELREGRTFVNLVRSNLAFRGQIIPAGHQLWTARLGTTIPSATGGGTQFIVPLDGGFVSYLGAWTNDVAADMAHIHQGGLLGSGPVVMPLTLTPDGGGVQGTFDPVMLAPNDTDGGLYVNVHTTDAGAGLIRGQIVKH